MSNVKHEQNLLFSQRRLRIPVLAVLLVTVIALGGLATPAQATTVQTDRFKMTDGGIADFGSGGHHFSVPDGNASVTWDFTPNSSGVMVARATVQGRLYLDTQFPGEVRLIAVYRTAVSGSAPLATRIIGHVKSDFGNINGAASSANQDDVNDNLSNSNLNEVDLILQENQFGTFKQVGSTKVLRVNNLRRYGLGVPLIINNPVGQFVGQVQILRTNGAMTARVDGSLASANTFPPLARLKIEALDINNNILGTTAQNPSSSFQRAAVVTALNSTGRIWKVRLSLGGQVAGDPNGVSNASVQTYDFVGNISPGTFELAPNDEVADVGERLIYAYTWTVPDPQNWHDLQALKFRVLSGSDPLITIYFNEADRSFALVDEETGQVGLAYAAGTNRQLQNSDATLYLRQTSVQASGPTSPSVTLMLSLAFKPRTAGDTLTIEVAATDDSGNHGDYEYAGTLTIK